MGQPQYQIMGYTDQGAPIYGRPVARTNGMAIASLVLGLMLGLGAILAIPFGHVARRQIRRTGEQGAGMALAGLILGYLSLAAAVVGVVFVVVVIGAFRSSTSNASSTYQSYSTGSSGWSVRRASGGTTTRASGSMTGLSSNLTTPNRPGAASSPLTERPSIR